MFSELDYELEQAGLEMEDPANQAIYSYAVCSPDELKALSRLLKQLNQDRVLLEKLRRKGIKLKRDISAEEMQKAITVAVTRAQTWITNAAIWLRDTSNQSRPSNTDDIFYESFGLEPDYPVGMMPQNLIDMAEKAGKVIRVGPRVTQLFNEIVDLLVLENISIYCLGSQEHCPGCGAPSAGYVACGSYTPTKHVSEYTVCLGYRFWKAWAMGDKEDMASFLMHGIFEAIQKNPDKKLVGKAACYERFVLRANRKPLHSYVKKQCPPKSRRAGKLTKESFTGEMFPADARLEHLMRRMDRLISREAERMIPKSKDDEPDDPGIPGLADLTIRTRRSEKMRHKDSRKKWDWHHPLGKYLGGADKQKLYRLNSILHYLYHRDLDLNVKIPRRASRRYYDSLSGPQMFELLKKLLVHAKAFDDQHKTTMLRRLRQGIRQSQPLKGRRWTPGSILANPTAAMRMLRFRRAR